MQTAFAGIAQVHPSEAISVTGDTDKGRTLEIFIHSESIERLRRTFRFADEHNQHIGHSQWHIDEDQAFPCEMCKSHAEVD